MQLSHAVTIAMVALALAGCQRTAEVSRPQVSTVAPPLNPAPVGGVQGSQLPAPAPTEFPTAPTTTTPTADPQQMAAVAANAPEVSRDALLGTWQTAVAGGNCQLALSLTQWTGGYRAASLRCPGEAANIAAWDVSGNQVVLNDRDGNRVASLYQSSAGRYDGTTASGQSISLSR